MIQFWGSNSACSDPKPVENSNFPAKYSFGNNVRARVVWAAAGPGSRAARDGSAAAWRFPWLDADLRIVRADLGIVHTDLCSGFHQATFFLFVCFCYFLKESLGFSL